VLLAVAMLAVVSLTVAVVILAGSNDATTSATSAADARSAPARTELRLPSHAGDHGGAPVPDVRVAPLPNSRRYDGGPDEGSRGVANSSAVPGIRYDGGPEEGSRGLAR
jgi:hypothetical protein